MLVPVSVNYTAVVVAAVAHMAIGAAWYSPMLFAKQWMGAVGKTKESMEIGKKKMGKYYGATALLALLTSYVLAHFVVYTGSTTIADGLQTGFWIWLGFVATVGLVQTIFAGRPLKLFYIDGGYHLVSLMVMGAILASMS